MCCKQQGALWKSFCFPFKGWSDNVCKPKSLRVTDSGTNPLNEPQSLVLPPAIFSKRLKKISKKAPSKNITRVQNCPDVTILNSLFSLCLLYFVFLSFSIISFCLLSMIFFVFFSSSFFLFLYFCHGAFLSSFFCSFAILTFCIFVFLSRHHADQMSEGSQVSKVTQMSEGSQVTHSSTDQIQVLYRAARAAKKFTWSLMLLCHH